MEAYIENLVWSQYLGHITHGPLVITGDPAQVSIALVEACRILKGSLDPPGIDYAAAAQPGPDTPNPEPPNVRVVQKLLDIDRVFTLALSRVPEKILDAWVDVRILGKTQDESARARRVSQKTISRYVAKADKALYLQMEKQAWQV